MNKKIIYILWPLMVIVGGFVLWQLNPPPEHQNFQEVESDDNDETLVSGPIQPIPLKVKLNPAKVDLGHKLFHDARLSKDNTISCASCHALDKGGVDKRQFSMGINGAFGDLNSPTVFNSGFNFKQFWDGRSDTLEEQSEEPVHNPKEMGSNWEEVIKKLSQDPKYVKVFNELYPDGIQSKNIQDALAIFQRSLYTPNSRFDRFLKGDTQALTAKEKKGYQMYQDLGCVVCHQGVNMGGNTFQTMGKLADYFEGKEIQKRDLGRFNVTGDERDRYKFKVPSLRNVALTAPYFHDGSAKTLEEAVSTMANYQLGYELTKEEVNHLVSFLKTLTGEYQGQSLDMTENSDGR